MGVFGHIGKCVNAVSILLTWFERRRDGLIVKILKIKKAAGNFIGTKGSPHNFQNISITIRIFTIRGWLGGLITNLHFGQGNVIVQGTMDSLCYLFDQNPQLQWKIVWKENKRGVKFDMSPFIRSYCVSGYITVANKWLFSPHLHFIIYSLPSIHIQSE